MQERKQGRAQVPKASASTHSGDLRPVYKLRLQLHWLCVLTFPCWRRLNLKTLNVISTTSTRVRVTNVKQRKITFNQYAS